MKKTFLFILLFFSIQLSAFDNTSIIHVTLTDSDVGLIQGTHYVKVKVIDRSKVKTYFEDYQYIEFNDGFGELKVGPVDESLSGSGQLAIELTIDNNKLIFPIYPSFLSIHSKYSDQLSNENALFIESDNVGLGTKVPNEKLSIDGNIKFINPSNSIIFSDDFSINRSYFSSLEETISSINQLITQTDNSSFNDVTTSINSILLTLDNISSTLDEVSSSANSNQMLINSLSLDFNILDTSLSESLIQITDLSNQSVSLSNDYSNLSNSLNIISENIVLVSSDYNLFKSSISSQINQLVSRNSIVLDELDLSIPLHISGEIRYDGLNYYAFKDNNWLQILLENDHSEIKTIDLSESFSSTYGAMGRNGNSYYMWLDGWAEIAMSSEIPDFSNLLNTTTVDEIVVVDSNGSLYKRSFEFDPQLSADDSLSISSNVISINDDLLSNGITIWNGSQLESLELSSSSGLSYHQGELILSEPFFVSNNQLLGLGVSPTEVLDINGAIRLRTMDSSNDFSSGSIIFDGSDFLGFDGSDWHILSNSSIEVTDDFDHSIWIYNDTHLIANPDNNVGIKLTNPQATLDVSGNIRIRDLPNTTSLTEFIVKDSDGDLFSRDISIDDFVTLNHEIFNDYISISNLSIEQNDILIYNGINWERSQLVSEILSSVNAIESILFSNNLNNNDLIYYSNNEWKFGNPFESSNDIIVSNQSFNLASKNATVGDHLVWDGDSWEPLSSNISLLSLENAQIGDQLYWNGNQWVPSSNSIVSFDYVGNDIGDILLWNGTHWQVSKNIAINEVQLDLVGENAGDYLRWNGEQWQSTAPLTFTGSNGVIIDNQTISLDSNLNWSDNTLTVGYESSGALLVNRLSSNLINPIQIVDSDDDILFEVNSAGQLSIGFTGKQNGYSIASNGFNFFTHSISQLQSSIGTTNIGTTEFGPTLLIQSIDSDDMASDRSVIEVLSVTGNVLLEVQDRGYIGISTPTPNATLDVNGFVKLKKYNTPPISCSIDSDGSIALTSQYKTCVCNGSEWVETNDGLSICSW